MSTVDVVVPCYNYARYLDECVNSVLRQEGVGVRVLIVDDCSTDNTPEVGARLAKDPRVEFRRHEKNRGHIATYNEGLIDWARSEYSLLLSADDALAPGALARACALMDRDEDVTMTFGSVLIVGSDQALPGEKDPREDVQVLSSSYFLQHCCAHGNPVPTPTAVVRTSIQQRVGGYRSQFPHAGDMEMWMRFAMHGRIGVFKAVQGYYRWHNRNMSSATYADLLNDQNERLEVYREVLAGSEATRIADSAALLSSARSSLGLEAFWLASRAFNAGDAASCARCLEFAAKVDPGLTQTAAWKRFRYKKMLGHRLWGALQPALRTLRGGPKHDDAITRPKFTPGQVNGWWPATSN